MVAVSAYMGGTNGSGVLARDECGVGGVCDICVWFGAWWEVLAVSG